MTIYKWKTSVFARINFYHHYYLWFKICCKEISISSNFCNRKLLIYWEFWKIFTLITVNNNKKIDKHTCFSLKIKDEYIVKNKTINSECLVFCLPTVHHNFNLILVGLCKNVLWQKWTLTHTGNTNIARFSFN